MILLSSYSPSSLSLEEERERESGLVSREVPYVNWKLRYDMVLCML